MKNLLLVCVFIIPFGINAQVVENDASHIFEKVEIEGGFPGGTVKWNEFVKRNFNFTRIEKSLPDSMNSFSDTAKIQFIVDKNGIIKDITFQSAVTISFKQSCIEVFKNSPHWNPANQCGRSVNAYKKETFIINIDRSIGKRVILVRS